MRLFAGLSRTDYEEVFRAIGALLDERGWTNVAIIEVDEGLVLQGTPKTSYQEQPHLEIYLLTDNDVEGVMRDALARRHAASAKPAAAPEPAVEAPPAVEESRAARRTAPAAPAAPPEEPPAPARARSYEGAEHWRKREGDLPLPSFEAEPQPPPSRAETVEPKPAGEASLETAVPDDQEAIDRGTARAAVVMAHIVAARLRSGTPLTGDDPDLKALLEQVQALDQEGIGKDV